MIVAGDSHDIRLPATHVALCGGPVPVTPGDGAAAAPHQELGFPQQR